MYQLSHIQSGCAVCNDYIQYLTPTGDHMGPYLYTNKYNLYLKQLLSQQQRGNRFNKYILSYFNNLFRSNSSMFNLVP